MRTLKTSFIYTAGLFVLLLLVNLIFSQKHITGIFEKGFWMGIGVLLTAVVILFIIIFIVVCISRFILKP